MKYDIFISYSSKDKDIADKIVDVIESTGHSCWIAPRNIPYGTPYARAIMEGIDECNKFVVLITDNSIKSDDVLNEIDNAHAIKKVIIPVKLTETQLPRELNYYLSRTQWLNLNSDNPQEIVKLLALSLPQEKQETKEILKGQDVIKTNEAHPKLPAMESNNEEEQKTEPIRVNIHELDKRHFLSKFKSISIAKIIGSSLILLSFLWIIYAYSHRCRNDNLLFISCIGSVLLLSLMAVALFKPSKLGMASIKECFIFLGVPGLLLFVVGGAYTIIEVQPDVHADSIIDSSNLQSFADDSLIISEQSSSLQILGEEAFNRKDYVEAVKYFKEMSDLGNSYGKYMLGKCYYSGLGVPKNFKTAYELFSQASMTNMPAAINSKGVCYLKGRGIEQNFNKAAECFRVAAEARLAIAQANLGDCYVYGNGVEQNYNTAKDWYEKAANQEYAPAAFNIGRLYYNGRPGVGLNYGKAALWYETSANLGLAEAQNSIGVCYLKGQGVVRNQSMAFLWFEKAAMQGNSTALYNLANCYRDGTGVKKDKTKAKQFYQEAIEKGSTDAITALKEL